MIPRTGDKGIVVDDVERDGIGVVVVDHDCNSSRKVVGIESSIYREKVGVKASLSNQMVSNRCSCCCSRNLRRAGK